MTPRINRAHDRLSEIVEDPEARDYERLRRASVRLLLALLDGRATHLAIRLYTLADAAQVLNDEAGDTEGRAEGYSRADKADSMRDVRRVRKLARMLEGGGA